MKILAVLLLLVSLLTGCGATAPAAEQATAEKTEKPAETKVAEATLVVEAPKEEIVTYAVDMAVRTDEAATEDGVPLATYRAVYPVLKVVREDGTAVETAETEAEQAAMEVAAVFNAKFGDWAEARGFKEMTAMVKEELAWFQEEGMDWYGGYTVELQCEVYQTEKLLSVTGLYYAYTGGAHPNTSLLAWNFDLTDGTFFGPELLSDQTEFQQVVSEQLAILALETAVENGMAPEEFFWEDYETLLDGWANYTVSFDETGMTVAFSPYELACYAAGPQEFHLTYNWLQPHLSEYGCELLGLPEADN